MPRNTLEEFIGKIQKLRIRLVASIVIPVFGWRMPGGRETRRLIRH